MQSMEKDFRFSTMKLDRNMMLILITLLMNSTLRMVGKGLQPCLCICKDGSFSTNIVYGQFLFSVTKILLIPVSFSLLTGADLM